MTQIFNRKIVKGTCPHSDKIIAIFEKTKDKTRIYFGDRDKVYIVSGAKFKEYKNIKDSLYVLIKFNKNTYKTLQEQYEKTYKEALFLKELTNGTINVFRTGSVARTSLQLFYDLCPVRETEPDPITPKESEILQKATIGALIWGIPYKGKGFKYDVVSEYPSIMISKGLKVPVGGVQFEKITNIDLQNMKYFKYGIYHVKVHNPDHRVFRENYEHWHTHTDLNYAMNELKYKLEFIEDGEDNAMIYTKLRSIRDMFKPFVDYLFEFKKQGFKEVKKYINALWGALCQKNTLDVPANKTYSDDMFFSMKPSFKTLRTDFNLENHVATIYKKETFYELPYARMGHFILASGRLKVSNIIRVNIDTVVRCHTDGIITTKRITNIKLGNDIGDLKFEEEGKCKIFDSCNYKFNGVKHGRKEEIQCMF